MPTVATATSSVKQESTVLIMECFALGLSVGSTARRCNVDRMDVVRLSNLLQLKGIRRDALEQAFEAIRPAFRNKLAEVVAGMVRQ